MIGNGNIRITKNFTASERLRAIFAERYLQAEGTKYRHNKVIEKKPVCNHNQKNKVVIK